MSHHDAQRSRTSSEFECLSESLFSLSPSNRLRLLLALLTLFVPLLCVSTQCNT